MPTPVVLRAPGAVSQRDRHGDAAADERFACRDALFHDDELAVRVAWSDNTAEVAARRRERADGTGEGMADEARDATPVEFDVPVFGVFLW